MSKSSLATASEQEIETLEEELISVEKEAERYIKAYGSNSLTLQQFDKFIKPINSKKSKVEALILRKRALLSETEKSIIVEETVDNFCKTARKVMYGLNFEAKQEILRNVVEKIVATQKEAKIYGYIPVKEKLNYEQRSIYRDCRPTKRRKINFIQCAS